jgi:hypothetical protein
MRLPAHLVLRIACAHLAAALLLPAVATAGGYQGWQFGMTQAQVKAVGNPSRYYDFRNGDVGAGKVPFEDGKALLSFYFTEGHMERAMLIAYKGADSDLARQAWAAAFSHLAHVCGDVESLAAGPGASSVDAALAAYSKAVPALAFGRRHQMGCLTMPADMRIWASATHLDDGSVMVAVNYGKP